MEKLDQLDLASLEFLNKAIRKAYFSQITVNDAVALTRSILVLEDIIKAQKEPVKPQPSVSGGDNPFDKVFIKELEAATKKKERSKKNG